MLSVAAWCDTRLHFVILFDVRVFQHRQLGTTASRTTNRPRVATTSYDLTDPEQCTALVNSTLTSKPYVSIPGLKSWPRKQAAFSNRR